MAKFHLSVCNGYHDILMMAFRLNGVATVNFKGVDWCCIIYGYKREETVSLLKILFLTILDIYIKLIVKKLISKIESTVIMTI